jgi:hypothetical protein
MFSKDRMWVKKNCRGRANKLSSLIRGNTPAFDWQDYRTKESFSKDNSFVQQAISFGSSSSSTSQEIPRVLCDRKFLSFIHKISLFLRILS